MLQFLVINWQISQ